ncbi:hypothetical protein DRJ04_09360 [Candidatus Aerophobetes bacterium]|uniref:Uncharacterized protein n=1 Tax=Aerophobetes bacterium TaxID=2030807 RepID=A0A662D980_UNCAE|nr:MAG: hypothetical protein DRJ04_09360 [Candidatus Aerophobetes bacterium]
MRWVEPGLTSPKSTKPGETPIESDCALPVKIHRNAIELKKKTRSLPSNIELYTNQINKNLGDVFLKLTKQSLT